MRSFFDRRPLIKQRISCAFFSLFSSLRFFVRCLCLWDKEIPFVLVCICFMPIGHIHTVCSSFLFLSLLWCLLRQTEREGNNEVTANKRHFTDFLACHHEQLKGYLGVSNWFIPFLQTERMMIYQCLSICPNVTRPSSRWINEVDLLYPSIPVYTPLSYNTRILHTFIDLAYLTNGFLRIESLWDSFFDWICQG